MDKGPFRYTVCGMCGKKFIKSANSIYTLNFAGKTSHFCSYGCYREAQKTREKFNGSEYKRYMKENNLHTTNRGVEL